ncbi:MAG TPA: YhjD/YihY/BrkB family envelope integrity protein [Steroidobacteraceae bacterium]|nr:YhjD/YihY/BrkB family envelope integrity protein [Steroidobacteraceae bacterium]
MRKWLNRLEDALWVHSRRTAPPWGMLLRGLRFPAALLRDFFTGELNVQAMSLAYTTLLSIVPLIAFSFSILKGLGAHVDLAGIIYEFFRPMGAAAAQLTASVMEFVKNMRGDVLGSIGFAFLVYTVVTTVQKIEASFNYVWRIERPRSLARRFAEYLTAMIVGPLLMAAALGVVAAARHGALALSLGSIVPLPWMFAILGGLLPYILVSAAFAAVYALIPNTRVKPAAALIGGIAAGVAWVLVGKMFAAFILYSSQLLAVYTSFAVVLTTLIWVYVSWLILLIGAQFAFYLQHPQYLRHGQDIVDLSGDAGERAGLMVMWLIGRDHASGVCRWSAGLLAAELDIPGAALDPVLESLERAGLIVAADQDRFLLGRDARDVALIDVWTAVRSQQRSRSPLHVRTAAPAEELMRQVQSAVHERLAGRTLYDFIAAA